MNDSSRGAGDLGPLSSMRWLRMAQKELREILRDRRTIMTLIGMPLLIYPLLGVTFQKLLVSQASQKTKYEYRIAVASQHDSQILNNLLQQCEREQARRVSRPAGSERLPMGTVDDPEFGFIVPDDPKTMVNVGDLVRDRTADVGLRLKSSTDDGPWQFELCYRSTSAFSQDAKRAIEDRLRLFNEMAINAFLRELTPPGVIPISFAPTPVTTVDAGPSFSMATLIPLILILMTVTGTVYPAIDLTAGERERGTLEALISAPIPRHELLFAKFLAVLTVAMLTALANLTSMVITAYSNGMEQLLFGSEGISLRTLTLMFGLLIVFSGFFASVILILTSFARSFKEAQAYLIPVMLVALAPGVLCLLPGIEMTGWMAVTPLVNIVILARDVFDGRIQGIWILVTLLSTVLYSAAALAVAARIFGTDAVLYGSEGSWSDLFRRPARPQSIASLSQALASLAILFPAFLILSGLPRRMAGESVGVWMAGNAIITIILFAMLPLAMARWGCVDVRNGFRLRAAPLLSFVAAALLGLSLWPIVIELSRMQMVSVDQYKELIDRLTASLAAIPLPLTLLALALIPAVCEELFFRGYLLTAFRGGMSTPIAIALSSCLFGLFHVIATLSFERFLPTTILGLILGFACYRTSSVFPGMVLHCTHNTLILTMQAYQKELMWLGIGDKPEDHVPAAWLASSSTVVIVGLLLLLAGTSRTNRALPDCSSSNL